MPKLVVTNGVSVDGFYEGPGGNPMDINMDSAFDAYNLERMEAAGTLLYGARTYQMLLGFWPSQADNPDASDVHRAIGRFNRDLPKLVVSDSLTEGDLGPHRATTTIVRRDDAKSVLAELKAGPGPDILTFGSRTTWNALLAADLVDELHLIVGPTPLAGGTPCFAERAPAMTLIDARRFDDSSNVVLSYRPSTL